MSVPRSQLAASVYRYLDNVADGPPPDGFPLQTVFEVLHEVEDEMLRDATLSDKGRRVTKYELPVTTSTFSVSRSDFDSPAAVYLRTDAPASNPAQDIWHPVEIVGHASVNQAAWDAKLAISFYGNPPKAEVSWEPESNQTLRIWYDRTASARTPTAQTEIGGLYDSYLILQTAAQCRELMKLDVGPVLAARLLRSQKQWEKQVSRSHQVGAAEKTPVFTPPSRRGYGYGRPRFRFP